MSLRRLHNTGGIAVNPATEDTLSAIRAQGDFIADESNIFFDFLRDSGGNIEQAVDGSVTPVEFSTPIVPAEKRLLIMRLMIYMEDSTAFSSSTFGGLPQLSVGWELKVNGVSMAKARNNRTLAIYMFDLTGNKLFGKENKTMIGRFSFSNFTDGADGISIREGEYLCTVVNDKLDELDYLEVMAQGVYKDA